MKRIYLDQNKWIDLAKASVGHADGKKYLETLLVAREGVKYGLCSFPLSDAHYQEISRVRSHKQRYDLSLVMAGLSLFHTIAPTRELLPGEIDQALLELFPDADTKPRQIRPFGIGVRHAFGGLFDPKTLPRLDEDMERFREFYLLLGPSEEDAKDMPNYTPYGGREIAEKWASNKEQYRRDILQPDNWHKGERMERVAKVTSLLDYQEPIEEALRRINLSGNHLMKTGKEGMSYFVEAVPLINTMEKLNKLRHQAVSKLWEANDLADLDALSRAFVYCDIVVTENMWVDLVNRSKLAEEYSTIVISDLEQLIMHLI